MIKSGRIFLFDSCHNVIRGRIYKSVFERKEIIKQWHRFYAAAINSCYIQISPDIDPKKNDKPTEKVLVVREKTVNKGIFNTKPLYNY